MTLTLKKRDSDGKVIDLPKEEAEQADITARAKRVMSVDQTGNYVSPSGETSLALQMDEADGGITYVGEAVIGSTSSSAVWRIKRLDEGGDPELIIEWADGNSDFDNIWDNRADLSYS